MSIDTRFGVACIRLDDSPIAESERFPPGSPLSVPRRRELGCGLLRALIRDAGLTREEFLSLLR